MKGIAPTNADVLVSHSRIVGFILSHFLKIWFFPPLAYGGRLSWLYLLYSFYEEVCICTAWIPVLLVGMRAWHS